MTERIDESLATERHSPFFVVGSPRSGTTLVGQVLDGHSNLTVYPELNYYGTFRPTAHLYGDLSVRANRRYFLNDVVEHVRLQHGRPPSVDVLEHQLVAPTFAGVLATLLQSFAAEQGKRRGGDKTPLNYLYLPEILTSFPDSPVIYLIRDPRDVVLSMRKAWSTTIREATGTWNKAYLQLAAAPPHGVHVVRYEDLVLDPLGTTERLCKILGEPFESRMVELTADRIPDQLKAVRHLDLTKLGGPVVPTSIGNHKEMLQPEIHEIEAACSMGMDEFGYRFSGPAPPITSPVVDPAPLVRHVTDRLRYYGWNGERWRRGTRRWKMMLRVSTRHAVRSLFRQDESAEA